MADPEAKHAVDYAFENLPPNMLEQIASCDFEYPDDEDKKEATMDGDVEGRLRRFLIQFLSLDPFEFVLFQQRVVYRRTCRFIGRLPMIPGNRMWAIAHSRSLATRFPMFKAALLAGFDSQGNEKEDDGKED